MTQQPSSANLLPIRHHNGEWEEGRYIVKLKSTADKGSHMNWLSPHVAADDSEVTHADWQSSIFHGYAGKFSESVTNHLRASPHVEYIETDAQISFDQADDDDDDDDNDDSDDDSIVNLPWIEYPTQHDAPWGLSRLSHDKLDQVKITDKTKRYNDDYDYTYHETAGGGGDIYILDGGVQIEHEDFDDGRATYGKDFTDDKDNLPHGNGHGTHCAAIAAGKRWGVAKKARIISVKVKDRNDKSIPSYVVAGINWVWENAYPTRETRRPIISYSQGRPLKAGAPTTSVEEALKNIVEHKVHVVVAAGNLDQDCSNTAPARLDCVITVGASDINDSRWHRDSEHGSNYGKGIDIWAPGKYITSAWIGSSNKETSPKTGTSAACPYVAGLVACLISVGGWIDTTEEMKGQLKKYSRKDKLDSTIKDSVNYLAAQFVLDS